MFVLGPNDGQFLITYIYGKKILSLGSGNDANGNLLDILQMEYEDQKSVHLYFYIPEDIALVKSIDQVIKDKNARGEKFK